MNHIPFNKPYFTGEELNFIAETFKNKKIAGDGDFTKKCHSFFEKKYGFKKVLLTTSCTDALEMAAILLDIKPEDEVIIHLYLPLIHLHYEVLKLFLLIAKKIIRTWM
jgi:dTDP-4-amino-4,6-dideoxygalactose transaminase